MKAVIDRIEGNYAALLVGEDETKVDLPIYLLPEGAKEGRWMTLTLELDKETNQKQKEKIVNMVNKLQNKPK